MNSRQLQYAIMLSESKSFSQVADHLGISQPALSKQIQNLENELGIRLFDRNHVPMSLTPAGAYFIRKAKDLLYEEDQLLKSLKQFKTGEYGRLDIGVTPFRSTYLMPDVVRRVKERYPGVQVVLNEKNSAQLRKDALEGKYDFAVVNLPVEESLLEVHKLEPDTLVLAVPNFMLEQLPDPQARVVDFADCKQLPFVVVGENQEMRQLFDRLCATADLQPNIAVEVVSITTAWAMAHAGVGATLLPFQFVHGGRFDDNLTLLQIKNNSYSRQPVIVYKKGQYLSEFARYAIGQMEKNN